MPRSVRIDAPDLVQHVIARGIEKRRIFIDDADRSHFVWRLGVVLAGCSMACMGWALMPNHVHLVLRTGPVALSTVRRSNPGACPDVPVRSGSTAVTSSRFKNVP